MGLPEKWLALRVEQGAAGWLSGFQVPRAPGELGTLQQWHREDWGICGVVETESE